MKLLQWALALLFAVALLATLVTHLAVYQQIDFIQQWLFYLLAADAVLVALLFVAVGGLMVHQWRAWQRGARGARLSLRLTILFWSMSLLPAVLLYSVSISTVFRGIESWFQIPLGSSFERGMAFGQDVVGGEFDRLEFTARDIAGSSRARSGRLPTYLEETRLLYHLQGIALYDNAGALRASSGVAEDALTAALTQRILAEGRTLRLSGSGAERRVEVAVPLPQEEGDTGVLWVVRALPAEVAAGLVEIERGQQQYEQFKLLRSGLNSSFILTMSLSLALIMFALGWLSLWLGRRLTRPLLRLSEAADAVGGGDFDHRLRTEHALQEMKHLNRSFNMMAGRLKQYQQQVGERQAALQEANAYMENLLASLTTGVLTFSADGRLLRHNAAAEAFCQCALAEWVGKPELPPSPITPALEGVIAAMRAEGAAQAPAAQMEERITLPQERVLLLRAAALPADAGGGMLVVMDDISDPLRVERQATWVEASRRFVHEVKNPLTPVQLSAERLHSKLSTHLQQEEAQLLERLTKEIINQVETIRNMVDTFRDYASERSRPPLRARQLNTLLEEVLSLYEYRVHIVRDLQPDLPQVGLNDDMRPLLINLLNNALDALHGRRDARIQVTTRAAEGGVQLIMEDNAGGVPAEMLSKLCEPYVTTKPQGTGLGLAVVRKTVDEHGGRLEIKNGAQGLYVCVHLPIFGECFYNNG